MTLRKVAACALVVLAGATQVRGASPPEDQPDFLNLGIREFRAAYDAWTPAAFLQAAEMFEADIAAHPNDARAWYWQGAVLFHLASYYLHGRDRDRDPRRGETYVDQGLRVLTEAVRLDPEFSESYALRGVLRGMKIKLNFWTVLANGPGVEQDRDRALALNPVNPLSLIHI